MKEFYEIITDNIFISLIILISTLAILQGIAAFGLKALEIIYNKNKQGKD